MEKNQYGRKTWDVAEYARIHKARKQGTLGASKGKDKTESEKRRLQTDSVQRIVGGIGIGGLGNSDDSSFGFGDANSWFTCRLCNRRFKDTLKLSEHFSSKMHLANLKELESTNGVSAGANNKEITVENVKMHLADLKMRLNPDIEL